MTGWSSRKTGGGLPSPESSWTRGGGCEKIARGPHTAASSPFICSSQKAPPGPWEPPELRPSSPAPALLQGSAKLMEQHKVAELEKAGEWGPGEFRAPSWLTPKRRFPGALGWGDAQRNSLYDSTSQTPSSREVGVEPLERFQRRPGITLGPTAPSALFLGSLAPGFLPKPRQEAGGGGDLLWPKALAGKGQLLDASPAASPVAQISHLPRGCSYGG